MAYRFESASDTNYTRNRLSVEELVYDDGVVLRALLGALKLQEDLAQTVLLRTGGGGLPPPCWRIRRTSPATTSTTASCKPTSPP